MPTTPLNAMGSSTGSLGGNMMGGSNQSQGMGYQMGMPQQGYGFQPQSGYGMQSSWGQPQQSPYGMQSMQMPQQQTQQPQTQTPSAGTSPAGWSESHGLTPQQVMWARNGAGPEEAQMLARSLGIDYTGDVNQTNPAWQQYHQIVNDYGGQGNFDWNSAVQSAQAAMSQQAPQSGMSSAPAGAQSMMGGMGGSLGGYGMMGGMGGYGQPPWMQGQTPGYGGMGYFNTQLQNPAQGVQAPQNTQFQGGNPMMIQGPQNPNANGSQTPQVSAINAPEAVNPFEDVALGQIAINNGDDPRYNTPGFQYHVADAGSIQRSVDNPSLNQNYIDPAQAAIHDVGAGQTYVDKMQQAYMDQARARLDPQWEQTQGDLENKLANMGLTRGSEAWNREMQNMQFGKNDAYGNAMNQAILTSGQEGQRVQGMDLARGQFANTAVQQDYGNQLTSQQAVNAAKNLQFNQNLGAGQFANQAQNQQFSQNIADAQLNNSGLSAQQQAAQGWGALYNQSAGQNMQNQLGYAGLNQQGQIANQGASLQGQQIGLGYAGLQNQANMANQSTGTQYANMQNQLSMANMQNQLGYAGLNNQAGIANMQTGAGLQQAGMQTGLGYAGLANNWNLGQMQNQLGYYNTNAQTGLGYANLQGNMQMDASHLAQQQQLQNYNITSGMMMLPLQLQNMAMQGMYPTGNPQMPGYSQAAYPNLPNSSGYAQGNTQAGNQSAGGIGGIVGSLAGFFL
jgi:hypothetical protein